MNLDETGHEEHLSDAALFALAAPAAGEPEALPGHLSNCRACSRALQEWKAAVKALGDAEAAELDRRTDAEWRLLEDATIQTIRRAGRPGRRAHPWRWAVAIAASLLIVALALPRGRSPEPAIAAAPTPSASAGNVELTGADAADDELLRQASFLASGGDIEGEGGLEGRL